MSFAMFLLGLVAGAVALAVLLVPRLRAAVDEAALAREAERAVGIELKVSGSAYERQLADLRTAGAEKATRQISEGLQKRGGAAEADRATAAGELGKRSEEIKRSLDPIAQNLKRVSDEVARLEQDRRTTQGQVRQMFESMTAEVAGSPTSAVIDSNICRTCPCVVRRSCSSRATSSLTRLRCCAMGSRLRLISSLAFPRAPRRRSPGQPPRRELLGERTAFSAPAVRRSRSCRFTRSRRGGLPTARSASPRGQGGLVDGGAGPRHQQDSQRHSTATQPEEEHRKARSASLAMGPDGVRAHLHARAELTENWDIWGLPCSQLSLRGEPTVEGT